MKKLCSLAMIVLLMVLCSCAKPASRMVALSIGMTKEEVITAVGKPTSVEYSEGVEYLYFAVTELPLNTNISRYVVVLFDGKVTSYGIQSNTDEW